MLQEYAVFFAGPIVVSDTNEHEQRECIELLPSRVYAEDRVDALYVLARDLGECKADLPSNIVITHIGDAPSGSERGVEDYA